MHFKNVFQLKFVLILQFLTTTEILCLDLQNKLGTYIKLLAVK